MFASVFYRGRVSPPAGGEFLFGRPKRNQKAARGPFRWTLRAHIHGPLDPRLRGPPMRELGGQRKGAGSSVERLPSSFAAAYLAVNRELGTPLFECAFVAVGLKFSSGIRREGQAPPLQVLKKAFLTWVGESLGAPVVNESGTVGSAKPGAAVGPHQPQFLQTQGPVAREKLRRSLRFCAPEVSGNFSGGSPVNGVQGGANMGA